MGLVDLAGNPIDPSGISFLGWDGVEDGTFPHQIYDYFLESIRRADADEGRLLLQRSLGGAQTVFEEVYGSIANLASLLDPETCPILALPSLGRLVGLTSSLDFLTGGLSEADYRLLVGIAAWMWKYKGTDKGFVETLEIVSKRPARLLDWFDLQNALEDQLEVGVLGIESDLWLLDPPGRQVALVPDGLTIERVLDGSTLPSSAGWTYSSEGAVEGATFSVSGGKVVQTQASADGGRYVLTDAELDAETAEVGGVFRLDTLGSVAGRPWHLRLADGTRAYRLTWSDGSVALETDTGVLVAGPRSLAFAEGTSHRVRLAKAGASVVEASVDGIDVFGEVSVAAFEASADLGYGFGYANGLPQSWTVSWDDVGPTPIFEFDLTTLLGASEAVPHPIRVRYVPQNTTVEVESCWRGGKNVCRVLDAFGLELPLVDPTVNDVRVGLDPAEYCSDLRVVDDGTLDRDFVENLVRVLRPDGERLFVRFVDFLDRFRRYFDWVEVTGTATPADGYVDLEDATFETVIRTDYPDDLAWEVPQLEARFALRDASASRWGEVRFLYTDEFNFYAVRINPNTRVIRLDRVLAGVRTTLDTAATLPVWWPDVARTVSVQTETVSGGTQIRYFLDGDLLGEAVDASHSTGRLAVACAKDQRLRLSYVELYQAPLSSVRVGP